MNIFQSYSTYRACIANWLYHLSHYLATARLSPLPDMHNNIRELATVHRDRHCFHALQFFGNKRNLTLTLFYVFVLSLTMWLAMLVMRVFARRTAVLVHCSVKTRARVVYNVVRVRETVVMIFVLTDPLNGWSLSVLKTDNVAPTLVLSEKPDIEGRTLKPTSSSYIAGRTRKSTSSSKGVKKGGSTAMLSHQPVFRLTGHLETNCQEKRV